MNNLIDKLLGRRPSPAQSAKDRLKFVLVTDRTTISPEDLRKMQSEILDIIRKYCRVSDADVEMKFEQRDRENFLVADIPLKASYGDDLSAVHFESTLASALDSPEEAAPTEDKIDDKADDKTIDKADDKTDDKAEEAIATEDVEVTPPTPETAEDATPDEADKDSPLEKVKVSGAPRGLSSDEVAKEKAAQQEKDENKSD